MDDTRRDVERLRERSADQIGQVSRAKGIVSNARVVAGTRIRVDSINRLHEDGYTVEQIIVEYPDLTEIDVLAALRYDKAAA